MACLVAGRCRAGWSRESSCPPLGVGPWPIAGTPGLPSSDSFQMLVPATAQDSLSGCSPGHPRATGLCLQLFYLGQGAGGRSPCRGGGMWALSRWGPLRALGSPWLPRDSRPARKVGTRACCAPCLWDRCHPDRGMSVLTLHLSLETAEDGHSPPCRPGAGGGALRKGKRLTVAFCRWWDYGCFSVF